MSVNEWTGIGNLTKDPETTYRQQDNSAICRFSIAINDGYGDKQTTNYIPIVAFGKIAESCQKYLAKGKKVCVVGRIKTGSYTSQQTGQKVYTTDIIASKVEFLTPNNQQEQQAGFAQPQHGFAQPQQNGFGQGYQQQSFGQQQTFGQQQNFAQPQGFSQPIQQPQQQAAPQAQPAQQPAQQAMDLENNPPPGFQAIQDEDIPF